MSKVHRLGHIHLWAKGFAVMGILGVALTMCVWGETPANPVRNPPQAPAMSESAVQHTSPATKASADSDYIIGNSDMLEINVWQEQGLTESVPVRSDGKISMPLIGEIQASGRTPAQLQEEITAKLRAYLTAPDVTVVVLQMNSRKFNVLGRVAKPGSYPLSATTTVLDAIAEAGGFLDFAKVKKIYILRRDDKGGLSHLPFNYKDVIQGEHPEQNIRLQPNDSVVVP